jgi:Flp pilus assembly protein TadG
MNFKSTNRKKQTGQALLEFALILPMLLLLIMAIVDFGWMLFNYNQLTNSLREGLRYGSVTGPNESNPQYLNCAGIRDRLARLAGSSGIKAANIKIFYDDGRPYAENADHRVGSCGADGLGDTFVKSTTWNPPGSDTGPRTVGQEIKSGDRVIIEIDVQVPFLTPMIKGMWRDGIRFYSKGARSIFLALGLG